MVDGLSDQAREIAGVNITAGSRLLRRLPPGPASCPAPSARTTLPESQRVAGLPSDAELERSGARIGYVHLNARPLFDVENHDENTALSRTRQSTAHRHARGDHRWTSCCSGAAIRIARRCSQESARILRDTRYLRDALIRPVAYHDGVVDVEVTTQDVWTLNPGFSFGRKGGKNTGGFEFEDLNFLGLGTQLGLGFTSRRRSRFEDHRLPRPAARLLVVGPRDALLRQQRRPAGGIRARAHPFYALDTRWAARRRRCSTTSRIDSRYDLGEVIDQLPDAARSSRLSTGDGPTACAAAGRAAIRWD